MKTIDEVKVAIAEVYDDLALIQRDVRATEAQAEPLTTEEHGKRYRRLADRLAGMRARVDDVADWAIENAKRCGS